MPTRKTVRPAPVKGRGTEAASRAATARGGARAQAGATQRGARADAAAPGAGTPAANAAGAPLAGTAGAASPQNIPAQSPAAIEQAERDKKGISRPGYTRRNLPTSGEFNGVTYGPGENVEIPVPYANHLDLIGVNPDASTEANRKTRFGGGKEDDQEAQGKAMKQQREDSEKAGVAHRQSPAFDAIAGQKKAGK